MIPLAYIHKVKDSMCKGAQIDDPENRFEVQEHAKKLGILAKIREARLRSSSEAEACLFDASLDDDEVMLRLMHAIDTNRNGFISRTELFKSRFFEKDENRATAKIFQSVFECDLEALEEALAHLDESDFGAFERRAAAVSGPERATMDRKASVRAVFDAALQEMAHAKSSLEEPVAASSSGVQKSIQEHISQGITKASLIQLAAKAGDGKLALALFALSKTLLAEGKKLDFLAVKQAARRVPRVSGQRMEWIRSMGLDGALARHLDPGTLDDGLHGVRDMSKGKALMALRAFFTDAERIFLKALDDLQKSTGSKSAAEANSKFADGFQGNFASLSDFHAGAEATLLLGYPNPDIIRGILLEHTAHPSVERLFMTPNYKIVTCLLIEYMWAMFEEQDRDVQHRVRERLTTISAERGCEQQTGAGNAEIRFPGEVGDKFTESLVMIEVVDLCHVDTAIMTKVCAEAVNAEGVLVTEEQRVRGASMLDQAACHAWLAKCDTILSTSQKLVQRSARENSHMIGVVLPMPRTAAEERCKDLQAAVEKAYPVMAARSETVTVFAAVKACKTWTFCACTSVGALRKSLSEQSLTDLRTLYQHLVPNEAESHESLCDAITNEFVCTELRGDLRAALKNASEAQLQTLVSSWGLPPAASLRKEEQIKQIEQSLVSEERWRQVEGWVGLYRGRLQGRTRLGLEKVIERAKERINLCRLTKGECLALYSYTGPEFVPMNAILRSFPKHILELLKGDHHQDNKLCTTLFCISSGLKKLARSTDLPPNSTVYRGLGKMQLPAQFWVPRGTPAWRGGVERAFMSTTADKAVALFYANGRGTVVEIGVGRIQIGGDVSFLSMVSIPPSDAPSYNSIYLPPCDCLRATVPAT
jgi:hypothetical protein